MSVIKWATTIVLLGICAAAATYGLGQWQLADLSAKHLAKFEASATAPLLEIGINSVADPDSIDRSLLKGRLDPQRHTLLRHRLADGREGYYVWTPLKFISGNSAGEYTMINRGWVPLAAAEQPLLLSVPDQDVEIEGLWVAVPASAGEGLSLEVCSSDSWPKILDAHQPNYADIKCLVNAQQVAQGLVLQTAPATAGFETDWIAEPRALHSLQQRQAWLGFIAAALALAGIPLVWLRRRRALPSTSATPPEVAVAAPGRAAPAPKGRLAR